MLAGEGGEASTTQTALGTHSPCSQVQFTKAGWVERGDSPQAPPVCKRLPTGRGLHCTGTKLQFSRWVLSLPRSGEKRKKPLPEAAPWNQSPPHPGKHRHSAGLVTGERSSLLTVPNPKITVLQPDTMVTAPRPSFMENLLVVSFDSFTGFPVRDFRVMDCFTEWANFTFVNN